jgi:hypothetical protein
MKAIDTINLPVNQVHPYAITIDGITNANSAIIASN